MIAALLPALAPILGDVIRRLFPDPAEAAKAEAELNRQLMSRAGELEQAATQVILAESKSEHTLAATWRPILMLTITAIIANNYVLAPYLNAMFGFGLTLDLPERLWDLLTVGVGGYVVGRSAEKVATVMRK